ncbi:MAG TPA: nucleotide exchange factor GrpE [Natronosporangium sp.]
MTDQAEPTPAAEPAPATEPTSEAEPKQLEFEELARRLDELADLFTRRLSDDRARRLAVEELTERLRQAELGPFRQILHPFVHGVALVIDRLDRYQGSDPEFVGSIRDELVDVLERHGVREIRVADGFDPTTQEAVELGHDPDRPAGAVLAVRRAGFAHGNWVFRPAQVVVNSDRATGQTESDLDESAGSAAPAEADPGEAGVAESSG